MGPAARRAASSRRCSRSEPGRPLARLAEDRRPPGDRPSPEDGGLVDDPPAWVRPREGRRHRGDVPDRSLVDLWPDWLRIVVHLAIVHPLKMEDWSMTLLHGSGRAKVGVIDEIFQIGAWSTSGPTG